jgi:hypothetical protein
MAWRAIQSALPKDAIISSDIGNNCAIGNAYPTFEEGRKYLAPGLFGPCGYGLPSIMGAKIGRRDVPVVGFAGDGAFGISMNEMSAIGREEWPAITMVIFRNYQWGAEKRNTTLWFDDNFVGTELDQQVSYAGVAKACGVEGVAVSTMDELRDALAKAVDAQMNDGVTTFIEVLLNQELGEPFRRDAMKKPVKAAELAREGEVDAIMKGQVHTSTFLKSLLPTKAGLRDKDTRCAHLFHITTPQSDRPLLLTDAALNVDPSIETRQACLAHAVALAQALGIPAQKLHFWPPQKMRRPPSPTQWKAQALPNGQRQTCPKPMSLAPSRWILSCPSRQPRSKVTQARSLVMLTSSSPPTSQLETPSSSLWCLAWAAARAGLSWALAFRSCSHPALKKPPRVLPPRPSAPSRPIR